MLIGTLLFCRTVKMVHHHLFPLVLILLWNPVYSAPEQIDCCVCGSLELRSPKGLQPNIYPSPFQVLVKEKQYAPGGLSINGKKNIKNSGIYFNSLYYFKSNYIECFISINVWHGWHFIQLWLIQMPWIDVGRCGMDWMVTSGL